MKQTLLVCLIFLGNSYCLNWSLPSSGDNYGFNHLSGYAITNNNFSNSWILLDINADGHKELIVTGEWNTIEDKAQVFNLNSSPYWKVYNKTETGFESNYSTWSVPTMNDSYGVATPSNSPSSQSATSSHSWQMMDMNGDNLPDLVFSGTWSSIEGKALVNGVNNSPYWEVYINNSNGFNSTPIQWSVPQFDNNLGPALFANYANGNSNSDTRSWVTQDINGDGRPDLIVTSMWNSTERELEVLGLHNSPYWDVYLNNGNSFNSSPTQWRVPEIASPQGLNSMASVASNSGSSLTWSFSDINGDHRPDIIVTAQYNSVENKTRVLGHFDTPHWAVYINTGSEFNTSAQGWNVPNLNTLGDELGMNNIFGTAGPSTNNFTWSLIDIDGDYRKDIVITAERNSVERKNEVFSLYSSPYWKIYKNNGSSFSLNASNWSLPQYSDGLGINSTSSYATSGSNLSRYSWALVDLENDNKPELVLMANWNSSESKAQVFNHSSAPHWLVYKNNNSGFSESPLSIDNKNTFSRKNYELIHNTLIVNADSEKTTSVQFLNSLGQKISIQYKFSNEILTSDFSTVAPGQYYLVLHQNNTSTTYSILKESK